MNLKRTNWTTEEVIELLEGMKLCTIGGKEDKYCKMENAAIARAKNFFEDFLRPEDEFGAMAYDPDSKQVYHIGPKLPR
jgi:hypothetical protein